MYIGIFVYNHLNEVARRIKNTTIIILLVFFGFAENYFFPILQKLLEIPLLFNYQDWSAIILLLILPITLIVVLNHSERGNRAKERTEAFIEAIKTAGLTKRENIVVNQIGITKNE